MKGTKIIGKNKEKEHSIVLCASGISSLATLLKQIWQAITFLNVHQDLLEKKKKKGEKSIAQDVIVQRYLLCVIHTLIFLNCALYTTEMNVHYEPLLQVVSIFINSAHS